MTTAREERLDAAVTCLMDLKAQVVALEALFGVLIPIWLRSLPAEEVRLFFEGAKALFERSESEDAFLLAAMGHAQRLAGELEQAICGARRDEGSCDELNAQPNSNGALA